MASIAPRAVRAGSFGVLDAAWLLHAEAAGPGGFAIARFGARRLLKFWPGRARPVQVAAATFDATENVALLLTLAGNGGSFAPPFAAVCSAIKFTLISIAIIYALCGLTLRLRVRLLKPS